MNFQDALKECHKDGATLVEYQTEAEFEVAKRMMGDQKSNNVFETN